MNRKEFVRKSFQLGMAGILLTGTALLLKRNQVALNCEPDRFCKSCSIYKNCELEKAKISRENGR